MSTKVKVFINDDWINLLDKNELNRFIEERAVESFIGSIIDMVKISKKYEDKLLCGVTYEADFRNVEIVTYCKNCKYFSELAYGKFCTFDETVVKRKPSDYCSRGEKHD